MTPYLLNLCDLFLTLYALDNGGVELNPLMQSVPVMVGWKVVGVGVLCWFINKQTKSANKQTALLAYFGISLCTSIYILTNLWHIVNLIKIGVI